MQRIDKGADGGYAVRRSSDEAVDSPCRPNMRPALTALAAVAALCWAGCAARHRPPATATPSEAPSPAAPQRSEEQLAAATVAVLQSDSANLQRAGQLRDAFRFQLQRARHYLQHGHTELGIAALQAAFFLVRGDEFGPHLFDDEGLAALELGATGLAQAGSEGQSEALYSLIVTHARPGRRREEAERHLAALRRWQSDTRLPGSMQARAAAQSAAEGRAALHASLANLKRAEEATASWLLRGIELREQQGPPRNQFEKDEFESAFAASASAPWVLTALRLRLGDAAGALESLERNDLQRRIPVELRQALRLAAEQDETRAWNGLFRAMRGAERSGEGSVGLGAALARAASFGAALELYRSAPGEFGAVVPLATLLLTQGLAEVTPALMREALFASGDPTDWDFALNLWGRGLLQADAVGDLPAARRLYASAAPLLSAGHDGQDRGNRTTPADLAFTIGEIEVRAGALERARGHLLEALKDGPRLEALELLAGIARQRGQQQAALEALQSAAAIAREGGAWSALAEAKLRQFQVHLDLDNSDLAEEALLEALKAGLQARSAARMAADLARAERMLAQILEQFGEKDAAQRAGRRAFEASRSDVSQMTRSVLDNARRALTLGDLKAARQAVRAALDADLADGDTVYAALWLKLLEKRLAVTADGTADEALAGIDEDAGWVAKLTAWGRGRLTNEGLLASAENLAERVEAQFYVAMVADDAGAGREALRAVAHSEAIQLLEVSIARDLLAQEGGQRRPRLPSGLELP